MALQGLDAEGMRPACSHLVPDLPPGFDGVGDFALRLALALQPQSFAARFLVGDPAWQGPPERCAAVHAQALPGRTAAAVEEMLEGGPGVLVLHYVGYGYAPRGCPTWLVDGVERWLESSSEHRLVTIFHEIYASGPPWRSSFWLSSRQRALARRLARASAAVITSLRSYGELLEHWVPEDRVHVIPVFSTVGEINHTTPLTRRAPRLVVFGGPGTRRRAYQEHGDELLLACRELEIEEILDVGSPVDHPRTIGAIPLRSLGSLPDHEVSEVLNTSLAGFLSYPPRFLPKSTSFAAYCAHGVLPICAAGGRWHGAVQDQPPFWAADRDSRGAAPAIAAAATDWYRGHSLDRHVTLYRRLLA